MQYLILIIGLVFADQLCKYLIKSGMVLYETIPLIENVFHITYIQNYGAAFSILQGKQVFLICISVAALGGAAFYLWIKRKQAHPVLLTGIALLISGGAGNLIDRIAYGYVVDFLDFRIWPIFNIADICVCCGCGLILLYVFFFESGRRNSCKKAPVKDAK